MKTIAPNRNSELRDLVGRIRKRQPTIDALRDKAGKVICEYLTEIIFQGHDLLAAKARVKFGTWMDYVRENIPEISHSTANHYMRLAANSERAPNLAEAGSQRQALLLCAGLEAQDSDGQDGKPSKQWPEYVEGTSRFSKFARFVEAHPIDKWPKEGVEQLRSDLEPIAKQLWPARFA